MAELDGGADLAVHISSCLVQFRIEIVVSGHHIVVNVDGIDPTNLFLDLRTLGVKEGVTNVLERCDVIGAEFSTALHGCGELGEELAELGDAFGHLFGGSFVEVIRGGGDVSDEGVSILDACPKVINALNLSSSEDTANQRSHVRDRDVFRASHIVARFFATNTSGISRTFIITAKIRKILGRDCCSNKG